MFAGEKLNGYSAKLNKESKDVAMDGPHTLQRTSLSQELRHLQELCKREGVTYAELLAEIDARSHGLLVLLLSLPFLIPSPIPGLSIPFGVVITVSGFRIMLDLGPWLPQSIHQKPVHQDVFTKIIKVGLRIASIIEKLAKPRGMLFVRHAWLIRFNGFLISLLGLCLALPLPPGTNFPPGLALVLLAVGTLEEDAIIAVLGYVAFALNLIFFGFLAWVGWGGIQLFSQRLFS